MIRGLLLSLLLALEAAAEAAVDDVDAHDLITGVLLQSNVTWQAGDHRKLEAGVTLTAGDRRDEYPRIDVGDGFTTGGGDRIFLRWNYFW